MLNYPLLSSIGKNRLANTCSYVIPICVQVSRNTEDILVTWSKPCSLFKAKPQSSSFDAIFIINWLLLFGAVRG